VHHHELSAGATVVLPVHRAQAEIDVFGHGGEEGIRGPPVS
jgi:hypothetical protein